jgi:ribosome maturation factor RimP
MEYASDDLTGAVDLRVTELGFELVDARKRVSRNRTVLQVRIDRQQAESGGGITADDCAFVSRGLETWFDESGVLGDRYVLEVSSPGIERPIRFARHWERYVGQDIRLRLGGRGRVKATIMRMQDRETVVLRLAADGKEQAVPIKKACDAVLVVDWSNLDRSLTRTESKESP